MSENNQAMSPLLAKHPHCPECGSVNLRQIKVRLWYVDELGQSLPGRRCIREGLV
jgi:hypothetical protein